MFTEDEAKQKSRPFPQQGNTLNLCRASKCMMWRWHHDRVKVHEFSADKMAEQGFSTIGLETSAIGNMHRMAKRTDHGRCGLAGAEIGGD